MPEPSEQESGRSAARARERAVGVVRALQDAGHEALFAGGCVRDELLGLHPTDFDVATDATPAQVGAIFRSTAHVGAHFGVALVRLGPGESVEVATFRRDGPYSDNRRPDAVTFADARADAHRRDFTINALFLDPLASADAGDIRGHVVDYVGGLADLRARVVRAVGRASDRFNEDHLRVLRAVRFAARLGFAIEPATASAIRGDAAGLVGVSRERIGHEVCRMMADPSRAVAARLLDELGLDEPVLGSSAKSEYPRLGGLGPGAGAGVDVALAAWAIDRDGVAASALGLRRALCLSNGVYRSVEAIIAGVLSLRHDWASMGVAEQKRSASAGWFDKALMILRAEQPEQAKAIAARVEALRATPGGLCPTPLLEGERLIALGHRPGPAFGPVLRAVYDAQLSGEIADLSEAEALAKKLMETFEPDRSPGV